MAHVSLVLSRWPFDEFVFSHKSGVDDDVDSLDDAERDKLFSVNTGKKAVVKSGLWGTLAVLVGGPIRLARFDRKFEDNELKAGEFEEFLLINGRKVYFATSGKITPHKLYSTVERYRTNEGKVNEFNFGYVRMVGQDEPYGLVAQTGNKSVKALRQGHDGACIQVTGGKSSQQQNILIHEAPHVGWVVGCIGPRPYGDRRAFADKPGNPSDLAFREILSFLKSNGGGKGQLFVLKI